MKAPQVILITGGSRSGKSRMALEKISGFPRKVFLATAVPIDEEMKRRIEAHRRERGADFETVEEKVSLARAIREKAPSADGILVDCLTFWLNNLLHYGADEKKEIEDFYAVLEEKPTTLVLVTNEINMGIMPADPLSRRFIELQGRINQEAARRADEVIFMVAGIPQILKESFIPR